MKKTKVSKSLVIVESPAKVKTLGKILGNKYEIKASYGHIRDLPQGKFGLNIKKDFAPKYEIIHGRAEKIVKELKSIAAKGGKVVLATDPDREGEAIAWHIVEALTLSPKQVARVTFNEITPPAVLEAFKKPRQISRDLVNAQQARRFLDRIVGYKLSPLLWKKIARGLSAGRVQSVAVKLLVEREKEIAQFKPQEYWKISAEFQAPVSKHQFPTRLNGAVGQDTNFQSILYKINDYRLGSPGDKAVDVTIASEMEAKKLVAVLEESNFIVSRISERESFQSPSPPFITSTLQQAAANQLGYSIKKTMMIAQQLYEGVEIAEEPTALITYMRTDAVRMSEIAINACRNFILKKYGAGYLHNPARRYKVKKSAQAAHEAIRPTYVEKTPAEIKDYLTPDQYKLYNLIWRRFVATQMKPAYWKSKSIEIETNLLNALELEVRLVREGGQLPPQKINVQRCSFGAEEKRLIFKGFLLLYEPEEILLPLLQEKEKVNPVKLTPTQNFTQPPPRYNEASLVKTLEKYGIGRPSTYAPIISTIQERGYVKKNERRQLVATELGILVTEKLLPYFSDILDTRFTSLMEERLDKIEEDKRDWIGTLKAFYRLFSRDLAKATQEMTSEKGKTSASGEKCAKCGRPLVERWGRYGKFLACSGYPECKTIVSLTPPAPTVVTNETCEKCGKPMVVKLNKRRQQFLACSGYPECRNARALPRHPKLANEAPESTEIITPVHTEE